MLERGKIETSKIKVEVINEDIHVELLELLELYCELLLARFGVLDQNSREPDPGVAEGVCSIIFAAPRTELKELHVLRDILMHKYGRDFSLKVMESQEGVSERVRLKFTVFRAIFSLINTLTQVARKLEVATPSIELVDAYLAEIAKAYSVNYIPASHKGGSEGGGEGDVKEAAKEADSDEENIKLPETKPPTPKLPDIPPTEDEDERKAQSSSKSTTTEPPPSYEDDFSALAKRFAALKKR